MSHRYPLHGGTSFGFNSGANLDDNRFDPCITSYDFDAPLTEAGDPTDKYYAVRKVIGKVSFFSSLNRFESHIVENKIFF